MKKIEKYGRINIPAVTVLVGILIVTAGCALPTVPETEPQASKTASASSQSEAKETIVSTSIPPGYSMEIIYVKFRGGTNIDQPEMALPPELRSSVATMARLFKQSDQDLEKIGASNLRLWFEITLNPDTDTAAFIEQLKSLDNVETVETAPLPAPPP